MYYFLCFNFDKWKESKHKSDKLNEDLAFFRLANTFLLALDGDIDFKPSAVMMLVDLMKRDLGVGAACGRIHPTGSGIITSRL